MSFILDALKKAEQDNITDPGRLHAFAQPVLQESKHKWLLSIILSLCSSLFVLGGYVAYQHVTTGNKDQTVNAPLNVATNTSTQQESLNQRHNVNQNTIDNINRGRDLQNTAVSNHTATGLPNGSPATTSSSIKPEISNNTGNATAPSLHTLTSRSKETNSRPSAADSTSIDNIADDPSPKAEPAAVARNVTPKQEKIAPPSGNTVQEIQPSTTQSNIELKDIEIGVHMYSEIPAKRFIYIGSTRYGEGDRINSEVVLEEITRSGVIVNFRGNLFRLPIDI